MPETYDYFRDSPLRLLGYANELAEAFRPIVHKYTVYSGYGLAIGYVLADVADKTYKMYKQEDTNRSKKCLMTAADACTWQSLASLIIPSVLINRFSVFTRYVMKRKTKFHDKRIKLTSVVLSIAIIPIIVKPIDKSVDLIMDNYVRDYLGTKRNH